MLTPRPSRAARIALALSLPVSALILSSPAHTAGEPDEDPAVGYVSGRIVADHINHDLLGLCSEACNVSSKSGAVSTLPDPDDFLKVSRKGRISSGADGVATGTYRIAFAGSTYPRSGGAFGYLQHVRGRYFTVTRKFRRGTAFTVEESADLDLGTIDLQVGRVRAKAMLHVYGSSMPVQYFRGVDIPKGGRIVVRSYGCGEARTRKVVRKRGDFRFSWQDANASDHYRKTLRLKVTYRLGPHRDTDTLSYDVSDFRWRCKE